VRLEPAEALAALEALVRAPAAVQA
jgi:hypothetical protein